MATIQDFEQDNQGKRYRDVLDHPFFRPALVAALAEMDTNEGQAAMIEAERIHKRPALVGVVNRIEGRPEFVSACARRRRSDNSRLKQAIGVACRLTMAELGWHTTGTKGVIRRFSKSFAVAERYTT